MVNRQDNKKNRGIEWTQPPYVSRGYTANAVRGCKHGCEWFLEGDDKKHAVCYAKTMAERIKSSSKGRSYGNGFEELSFHPNELQKIKNMTVPSCFFMGSMSDFFGVGVLDEWIEKTIQTMEQSPQHVFQFLTKNPPNMAKWADKMPSNAWLGISAPPQVMFGNRLSDEQQERWWSSSLNTLAGLDNPVKFVSIEPLSWGRDTHGNIMTDTLGKFIQNIQWVIIGAASYGAKVIQPNKDVFVDIMQICSSYNVPVFFKGNIDEQLAYDVCGAWLEQYPSPELFDYKPMGLL